MEWVTLLVVVPAVLIPLVILFGFTGCGAGLAPPPPLQPPVVRVATPIDERTIRLEWTNPYSSPVRFDILRTPEGPGPPPPDDQQSPFIEQQLAPGVTYSYRVRAVRLSDGETTEYSEVATAVTWASAFSANFAIGGQNVDASGDCIVQRFDPPSLTRPGNLIEIVATAASDAQLVVSRITISTADPAGESFDSTDSPTEVKGPFSAEAGLTFDVRAAYRVETSKPLLIAFDVSAPGNTRFTARDDCDAFTLAGAPQQPAEQALEKNRSGFTPRPNQVWLITQLLVATEWRIS
jgi:hypothetical protein